MMSLYLNLFHLSAVACMSLSSLGNLNASQPQEKETVLYCYCNLPECITTGYMCKSQGLGCFSDLDAYMNVDRATHGCLDRLPRERQDECGNVPGVPPIHQLSLLLCCHEAMCNHVDSPETRHKYNETIFAVAAVIGAGSEKVMDRGNYKSQEIWFKVATIAVPICGALILLMLIALAVRMLRSDSLDETVLAAKLRNKQCFPVMNGSIQPSHTLGGSGGDKKLPLLFQQNDTRVKAPPLQEKNVANAKLNSLPPESAFIDFEKRTDPSECNLYRGVTAPLLASEVPDKLDYKRPPIWPDNNV